MPDRKQQVLHKMKNKFVYNEWEEWKHQREEPKIEIPQVVPTPKVPTEKRKITRDELEKTQKLQGVSYFPGSSDKRFVHSLEKATLETEITEKMARYIGIIWYKYRRQLGHNDPKPDEYRSK